MGFVEGRAVTVDAHRCWTVHYYWGEVALLQVLALQRSWMRRWRKEESSQIMRFSKLQATRASERREREEDKLIFLHANNIGTSITYTCLVSLLIFPT